MSTNPAADSAAAPTAAATGAPRRGLWAALALAAASTVLMVGLWFAFAPRERLDETAFIDLAEAGQFDQAERRLRDRLASSPDDRRAQFLLAQILLERPDLADAGVRADNATESLELLGRLGDAPSTGRPDSLAVRLYYRGKAAKILKRWDEAEDAWLEALRVDPLVPEAGFALLDLYYLEGRRSEARELALRLYESEPNARDRALIMLALLFQDSVKADANSLTPILEGVAQAEPGGVHAGVAYGLTLIRAGDTERGLGVLRKLYDQSGSTASDSARGQALLEGLLAGLDAAGQPDEVRALFERQPEELRRLPALARYRGLLALQNGEWDEAIAAFEAARVADPADFELNVRLARALRMAGRESEADALDAQILAQRDAAKGLLALHDEASAVPTLGTAPHAELGQRIASSYEVLARKPEAKAWVEIGAGQVERR